MTILPFPMLWFGKLFTISLHTNPPKAAKRVTYIPYYSIKFLPKQFVTAWPILGLAFNST